MLFIFSTSCLYWWVKEYILLTIRIELFALLKSPMPEVINVVFRGTGKLYRNFARNTILNEGNCYSPLFLNPLSQKMKNGIYFLFSFIDCFTLWTGMIGVRSVRCSWSVLQKLCGEANSLGFATAIERTGFCLIKYIWGFRSRNAEASGLSELVLASPFSRCVSEHQRRTWTAGAGHGSIVGYCFVIILPRFIK